MRRLIEYEVHEKICQSVFYIPEQTTNPPISPVNLITWAFVVLSGITLLTATIVIIL